MSNKFLIVGLGNVGIEYADTRHNVGFMALDHIAHNFHITYISKPKFKADLGTGQITGNNILLAKPATFMNLSGISVASICSYNKINTENIFVIHDDLDLEVGRIKIKFAGGNAGHNGLKSLDSNIGNNYYRIRIGIGRPLNPYIEISDYVLSRFSNPEYEKIMQSIQIVSDNIHYLFTNQIEEFKKQIS